MNYRMLGSTDLKVSELGFGCGAVGGLMVRGEPAEMTRVVARAIEAGVTYFDTAQMYGDGISETNLGRVLGELKADVVVGTKIRLNAAEMDDIPSAVVTAVETSLRRLQMESVDLMQLHNTIMPQRQAARGWVGVDDLPPVIETFQRLREQGKVRYWGINGLGDSEALLQAVATTEAHTIQVCYNLLNPSAAVPVPADFPYQDYAQLIDRAAERGMGVIAIRVLAGGALSGMDARHPVAAASVAPIATGSSYQEDVAQAQRFQFLVKQGVVESLVEAAIRFAISNPHVSTAMVGISNMEQLEQAIAAVNRGPLPEWESMVVQSRKG